MPPETVHVEKVSIVGDLKSVIVGNDSGHYWLLCNIKAAGCITPEPTAGYFLFNKNTHWKLPGAKNFIDLNWIQDWTVSYPNGENIALVPDGDTGAQAGFGIFVLDRWTKK